MRIITIIAAALALAGCNGIVTRAVSAMPSVQNCQRVEYERIGNQLTIRAECQLPITGSTVPVVDAAL